jgi:predicted HicB family RNase H-like nuclease
MVVGHAWRSRHAPLERGVMGYLQVRDVPDDLHRAARVEALEAGESLRALVIRALEREVERMRRERERRRGDR